MLTDDELMRWSLAEPAEIEKEIAKKLELMRKLVGQLYPRIVADEIAQLQAVLSGAGQEGI
jgi:hypothetical protein